MKTLLLGVLLTIAVIPLAPNVSAVGTCTEATNSVNTGPDCPYLFCYGTSWSYPDRYYHCYNCFDPFEAECTWP